MLDIRFHIKLFIVGVLLLGFGQRLLSQSIQIDHVIAVFPNLKEAIATYEAKGFTLKEGKLHSNGLLNAHVKFSNKTSLELMSVKGEGTDPISKEYIRLLQSGVKGAYIAITGIETSKFESILKQQQIRYKSIKGKLWDYIIFEDSRLAHIFFIRYQIDVKDASHFYNHKNGITKIKEVEIEGGQFVINFLNSIGVKMIQNRGETTTGDIVVVPLRRKNTRPIVKSLLFTSEVSKKNIRVDL